MQAIASGNLGGQHSEHHRETLKLPFQFGALRQDFEQAGRVYTISSCVGLGDYSQPTRPESKYDWQTNKPFVSD
jgi:hypothetical protein